VSFGDGGPGPWVTARFDSECGTCGGLIDEGDRIRSDGYGEWLCEPCGEDAEEDADL
jgi:hypothetical protein